MEPSKDQVQIPADGVVTEESVTADVMTGGVVTEEPGRAATPTSSTGKAIREIVETLLLALLIFVLVRAVVLNFRVDGHSMDPNLDNTEMLLVNRNAYLDIDLNWWRNLLPGDDEGGHDYAYPFGKPDRGDIVVFSPPTNSDKPYIKRVIGLPGETVSFQDGYVYIDGKRLEESYIEGPITECNRRDCESVTIPEDSVFLMGDNRNNSSDSRSFGPVEIGAIIGKAFVTYWPVDDIGLVPHEDYAGISG